MYPPGAEHAQALRRAAPRASIEAAADEPAARTLMAEADAVLGNRWFRQSLPAARRLRWMQSNSMGMDLVLGAGDALGAVVVTCARGVYDEEVAEHAVALALALGRGLHLARDAQRRRQWPRRHLITLAGGRAMVLGYGGVGRATARRLASLGMSVRGVRRRHAGTPAAGGDGVVLHGPDSWREQLRATDLLVLALPLTRATEGIVGAAELEALPRGALVVNVGRGGTLDEQALLGELRRGRLGGAALDVVAEEPPAAGSALWTEPGLLLTPHVARSPERPPYRWEPLFVENLRRFSAGEPLLNVVDREAGY